MAQCHIESGNFSRKMGALADIECLVLVLYFIALKYMFIYNALRKNKWWSYFAGDCIWVNPLAWYKVLK